MVPPLPVPSDVAEERVAVDTDHVVAKLLGHGWHGVAQVTPQDAGPKAESLPAVDVHEGRESGPLRRRDGAMRPSAEAGS